MASQVKAVVGVVYEDSGFSILDEKQLSSQLGLPGTFGIRNGAQASAALRQVNQNDNDRRILGLAYVSSETNGEVEWKVESPELEDRVFSDEDLDEILREFRRRNA